MDVNAKMSLSTPSESLASAREQIQKSQEEKKSNTVAGDFETFLKLLTTQLQNQDPMKPTESTEFVAQLASFSSVEQQVRTNDQLGNILGALGSSTSAGLADWIGKEIRAAGKAAFGGEAVDVAVKPVPGAERAQLVVTNDFGDEVARLTVDPKDASLSWDGKNSLGVTQPNGLYSFKVESFKGDEKIGEAKGEVFDTVTEVRLEEGQAVLLLKGGGRANASDVTSIR
jgi:flagellar basal-body rod modification protein FlgD